MCPHAFLLGWKANHFPALTKEKSKGSRKYFHSSSTKHQGTHEFNMLKSQEWETYNQNWISTWKGPAKLYSPFKNKIKRNERVTQWLSLDLLGNLLQMFDWALQVGCMGSHRINTDTWVFSNEKNITLLQTATWSHISNGSFGVLPKCIIK